MNGREAIKRVAKQVGDILGKTLGPAGRNYFLHSGITNDGRTIVSEIRFEDECEDNVSLAFHEMARGRRTKMRATERLLQWLSELNWLKTLWIKYPT